jgi:hypothetical protein
MPQPFRFPANFADAPTAITGTALLDGRRYALRFFPNPRANDGKGAWYLDFYSVLGVPAVVARKLTLSDDLFGSYRTTVANIPPGRIVVRRTDEVAEDPRPTLKGEVGSQVATLGSPLLVVEYIPIDEDTV